MVKVRWYVRSAGGAAGRFIQILFILVGAPNATAALVAVRATRNGMRKRGPRAFGGSELVL